MRKRTAPHLLAAASVLAILSGCSTPSPDGTTPSPTLDDRPLTVDDLENLVGADDWLERMEYTEDGSVVTAEEHLQPVLEDWIFVQGSPEPCAHALIAQRVVTAAEEGDRADDPVISIGYWTEWASNGNPRGDVIVEARVFDDEETAAGFLAWLPDVAAACPTGYSLTSPFTGEVMWASSTVQVGEFDDVPDGVSAAVLDEPPAEGHAGVQRTVFLQRKNVVVGIETDSGGSATFTAADVDPLVATIAERLAEL